jgi:hypothetical protein
MDVAMKKNLFKKPSSLYLFLVLPVAATLLGFVLSYNTSTKSASLAEIKYGVNLCFTRLTQSVIAMQSHDYFSKHLERSYIDFTNECFFEFKEKVTGTFANAEASKLVDQLLSDAQAFSKSLINVLGQRQVEVTKSSIQSQILPGYSKVDYSRFNLNQWIKAQEGSGTFWGWQTFAFLAILLALNALIVFLFFRVKQHFDFQTDIEEKATVLANDDEVQPHRLEVFLCEILDKFQLNKSQDILKKYAECLIQQSQLLAKMKGIKESTPEPKNSFDEWQEKSLTKVQEQVEAMPPAAPINFVANSDENADDQVATWTSEDEEANILQEVEEQQYPLTSIIPVNEPLCALSDVLQTTSKSLAKNNSTTAIIHKSSHAPFWLRGDHEHYEQLFIALINKIEQRFKEFAVTSQDCSINVDYSFDSNLNQTEIKIIAKGAMFHIDDLEYFHDQDHLTVDSYNVIIKEMVKELYAEIALKNLIGDDLDDNSLQILLKVPVKGRELENNSSVKVVQLLKGKKKDLIPSKVKEISI